MVTRKEFPTPHVSRPEGHAHRVETWWDRWSQNYITQRLDAEGNQVGNAEYSGNRTDAKWDHNWLISEIAKETT